MRGKYHLTPALIISSVIIGLFFAASGCNDLSTGTESHDPISELVITKKSTPDQTIWVGDIIDLSAKAITESGVEINIHQADWSIDNEDIAGISQNGQFQAKKNGTVTVSASLQSFTGHLQIEIFTYDVIFNSDVEGINKPFRIPFDGSEQPEVLFDPGIAVTEAVISPDNRNIVYTSPGADSNIDIYLYELDSGTNRRFTSDSGMEDMPAWSPDSGDIVFRSSAGQSNGNIYLYNLATEQMTNLTSDSLAAYSEERHPFWSPHGDKIVYASDVSGSMNLWWMNTDGTSKHQVTDTENFTSEPAWSPDGSKIVYRESYHGGSDIVLLNLADMTETRIGLEGYQQMPSWSPDGRWIIFSSQLTLQGQAEVYAIRPNGTDLRIITTNPAWGGGMNPSFIVRDN